MNKVIYKNVYSFAVADLIKAGKEVFVLDRSSLSVMAVSEMNALEFINATSDDNNANRYEFWIEEQEETANE